jgi:hypothetical protein
MAWRRSAVEMLALNAFGSAYRVRRVLFTGHTGFKGSWSCLWLQALGAKVTGLVLDPPSDPNHWGLLKLSTKDRRIDIRDEAAVRSLFAAETAGETSCADACSLAPTGRGTVRLRRCSETLLARGQSSGGEWHPVPTHTRRECCKSTAPRRRRDSGGAPSGMKCRAPTN